MMDKKVTEFLMSEWARENGHESGGWHLTDKNVITCSFHKITNLGVVVTK